MYHELRHNKCVPVEEDANRYHRELAKALAKNVREMDDPTHVDPLALSVSAEEPHAFVSVVLAISEEPTPPVVYAFYVTGISRVKAKRK